MFAVAAAIAELAAKVALWTAQRLFLTALLMVGLPFVLKGVINWFFDQIITFVLSYIPNISTTLASHTLTIHGLTSWIYNETYCATALSIVLAAVSVRFLLNFVPFVK